jgi:hypothetical protein
VSSREACFWICVVLMLIGSPIGEVLVVLVHPTITSAFVLVQRKPRRGATARCRGYTGWLASSGCSPVSRLISGASSGHTVINIASGAISTAM